MKKLFVFVVAVIVFTACNTAKTTKVEISPAGTWIYSITDTPEGDFTGDFRVTSQDKNYTAKLMAGGNELPFNTCAWNNATSKITGDFNYSGNSIFFEATLSGEELTGTVSTQGESFPFKATRKK